MLHISGLQHKSISDQVIGIEYVDSQGEIQVVTDPNQLKMAAGSMGLLGVVVSLTFKMDKMTYAVWGPQIVDQTMEEYIPRFESSALPNSTLSLFTDHYYAEWISFPSHHLGSLKPVLWQNVWNNNGKKEDAVDLITDNDNEFQISYNFLCEVANGLVKTLMYTFDSEEALQWVYGWIVGVANRLIIQDLPEPVTTTVTEALHFQRGLHTMTVKAIEVNIT